MTILLKDKKMDNKELKCNCVGMLGGKYSNLLDIVRRVYDTNGIAPTQTTCGGGNREIKIIDDNSTSSTVTTRPEGLRYAILVVDEQNGSSTKHTTERIRKLTPKECGRLMGVRDKDIDTMAVNQSNSSQYHLFGDSIVVDVLMAIFGQML